MLCDKRQKELGNHCPYGSGGLERSRVRPRINLVRENSWSFTSAAVTVKTPSFSFPAPLSFFRALCLPHNHLPPSFVHDRLSPAFYPTPHPPSPTSPQPPSNRLPIKPLTYMWVMMMNAGCEQNILFSFHRPAERSRRRERERGRRCFRRISGWTGLLMSVLLKKNNL